MIHVAIVSHGHEKLLIDSQLGGLINNSAEITVWLKDNKPSAELKHYCEQQGVHYTSQSPGMGFGENNNFLFDLVRSEAHFSATDYFIVMNPDISTSREILIELVYRMKSDACPIATIDLFKDPEHRTPDANVRQFPNLGSLWKLITAHSLTKNYDKKTFLMPSTVDWASGAFLAFEAAHYEKLKGFDTAYFMYFEDVDICYRSSQLLGKKVLFYPQFSAVHLAGHKNRNLISQHAYWFLSSFLRFLSRRYFVYRRVLPASAPVTTK